MRKWQPEKLFFQQDNTIFPISLHCAPSNFLVHLKKTQIIRKEKTAITIHSFNYVEAEQLHRSQNKREE